jgi:hypothetical protein
MLGDGGVGGEGVEIKWIQPQVGVLPEGWMFRAIRCRA